MRAFALLFFCLTLGCASATKTEVVSLDAPTGSDNVVVTWSGGQLTQGDLTEYAGVQLIQLEAKYLTERHDALRASLDEILSEKLLELEATAGGHKDVEALLEAEITAKIAAPTEEEILQFYAVMKRRLRGEPLEAVRPMVIQELTRRKQGERFSEYLSHVREKYKVAVTLARPELPRLPVSVDDDPSKGPEDAPVTIVQFAEFQCPYCGRAKESVDQVMKEDPG